MLARNDLWLLEDLILDQPLDPLTVPEMKRYLTNNRADEDLGLRSLLESPEAIPWAWPGDHRARERRAAHPASR